MLVIYLFLYSTFCVVLVFSIFLKYYYISQLLSWEMRTAHFPFFVLYQAAKKLSQDVLETICRRCTSCNMT